MFEIKIVVALTGASGIQYGINLLKFLDNQDDAKVFLTISSAGKELVEIETDFELAKIKEYSDEFFEEKEMEASIASGSFIHDGMVVIPASQKTIGAISHGFSNNLIVRAADICLKEGRKLVLVPRETPLSDIHLENMLKLSKAGATILPASPGFYHNPKKINDLIDFIVGRVLDQFSINHDLFERWE